MFSLSCVRSMFTISTRATPSFPNSPVETNCSSKIPTTTPKLLKTPAVNSSRIQILMKTQTVPDERFRPMMIYSGYNCYRYLDKAMENWVDLWILSTSYHMF